MKGDLGVYQNRGRIRPLMIGKSSPRADRHLPGPRNKERWFGWVVVLFLQWSQLLQDKSSLWWTGLAKTAQTGLRCWVGYPQKGAFRGGGAQA